MIFEDFILNMEALEPTLDLGWTGYQGPYPVEVLVLNEDRQVMLKQHFPAAPLRVINPQLRPGLYFYSLLQNGDCIGEGQFRFP